MWEWLGYTALPQQAIACCATQSPGPFVDSHLERPIECSSYHRRPCGRRVYLGDTWYLKGALRTERAGASGSANVIWDEDETPIKCEQKSRSLPIRSRPVSVSFLTNRSKPALPKVIIRRHMLPAGRHNPYSEHGGAFCATMLSGIEHRQQAL